MFDISDRKIYWNDKSITKNVRYEFKKISPMN